MTLTLAPAIFLDRDGVILEHRDNYVKSLVEAVIMPAALAALQRLAPSPYRIVIVTNQALVGRGIIPLGEAQAINQWTVDEIRRAGGRIDGSYLCPHHPDDHCACRKPKPGMLLDAAADLHLDLSRSVMIGDAITDLQAGQAAGARPILVRTGRGRAQFELLHTNGLSHTPVFDDLAQSVQAILDGQFG
jgi:D-glycero-D-manno-heptose 1,7-bisphosphate phosphatase